MPSAESTLITGASGIPGPENRTRRLHDVRRFPSPDAWASAIGLAMRARVDAPYQVGWCSWYHWFHDITEAALREQLALADAWPFDVFQLDDGFQAAIGDWLQTNEKFPTAIDGIASAIARAALRLASQHTITRSSVSPAFWI